MSYDRANYYILVFMFFIYIQEGAVVRSCNDIKKTFVSIC